MQVNIKGIGPVNFPEGTSQAQIKQILSTSFAKKENNDFTLKEIEAMVKGFIAEQVKPEKQIAPVVNVDLEPSFEVTVPDIDVSSIAEAISKLEMKAPDVCVNMDKIDIPAPEITVNMPDNKDQIRITVESRTKGGAIDSLLLTHVKAKKTK